MDCFGVSNTTIKSICNIVKTAKTSGLWKCSDRVIHPKSGVRDVQTLQIIFHKKTSAVQLHCTLYCTNKGNSKCQSAPTSPNVLSLTEEDIIGKKNCIIC